MLICPVCGRHNPEEANTCAECDADLALAKVRACPTCGAYNNIREPFCLHCLTLLPPAQGPNDAVQADAESSADPLADLTLGLPVAAPDLTPQPEMPAPAKASIPQFPLERLAPTHPDDKRSGPPIFSRVLRAGLYFLVALAALIPFLINLSPPITATARGAVWTLERSLTDLPENATVLLAFDYGPAYAAELDALAAIVLRKLTQRSANVLVMSTRPLGMGVAAPKVVSSLSGTYGQDYLFLGYLMGEATGLRMLQSGFVSAFVHDYAQQQPLDTFPLIQNLAAAPVQRIIVLAENAEDIQNWIEQVTSQSPLSLDALVSAKAQPSLVAYYTAGQLNSLTGGQPAAIEYMQAVDGAVPDWRYSFGLAALIVVLVVAVAIANIRSHVRTK